MFGCQSKTILHTDMLQLDSMNVASFKVQVYECLLSAVLCSSTARQFCAVKLP